MPEEGKYDAELTQLTPVGGLIESEHGLSVLVPTPSSSIPPTHSVSSPSSKKKKSDSSLGSAAWKESKRAFISSLVLMLLCGSSNDYLGKLIYQILPEITDNDIGLEIDYWVTWILTAGSFFICSFAIINGRKSFKILTMKMFLKICIPSFMDLFVTGGRYLAIIFLPAAIISILKNGFQLIFLALISRYYLKRNLTKIQWIGLFITIIGLIIVSFQDVITNIVNNDTTHLKESIFGLILLIVIGFFGAIRNMMEEILLQNDNEDISLDSNFLVGMESIISLLFMLIFAIIYLFTDIIQNGGGQQHIYFVTDYFLSNTVFIVLFILFLLAIYGKDTMQMKIAKLTSSLTRKLFQQLYPIGTWILSLTTYYFYSSKYGEKWDNYSFLRVIGFIIILVGTYLYIKPPSILSSATHQAIKTKDDDNDEADDYHTDDNRGDLIELM